MCIRFSLLATEVDLLFKRAPQRADGQYVSMKHIKIALIVILSVMTLGLCGILVSGIMERNLFRESGRQQYNEVELVLEREIPVDGINDISVLYNMNDNDIYLFESGTDTVIIKEYSSSEMDANELSAINVSEDSIEVKGAGRNIHEGFRFFFFNSYYYARHYTEVYIPASFSGELLLETASGNIISDCDMNLEKSFTVASASGDVSFGSVTADNMSVSTSSGYIIMEKIDTNVNGSIGEISVETSSGDVNIKELTGVTRMESSSGYVNAEKITGDTQIKTTSGDMDIKEIVGEVKTESSSGNVSIGNVTGNAKIRTTSGDISIQHIEGGLQSVSSSGYVRVLEGNGDRSISTSSGDIILEVIEGNFQFSTQSGEIQAAIQKGEGSIETTSGNIRLELAELIGVLDINSSSGSVSVQLSSDTEFGFLADTVSGSINTFFDSDPGIICMEDQVQGTYGANGQGNQVTIRTTSGDVSVSKQ